MKNRDPHTSKHPAVDERLDRRDFGLGAAYYEAFIEALENPPPANAKLRRLMASKAPWEAGAL
jgi:uncharacterized protein (DUF1778 family)